MSLVDPESPSGVCGGGLNQAQGLRCPCVASGFLVFCIADEDSKFKSASVHGCISVYVYTLDLVEILPSRTSGDSGV